LYYEAAASVGVVFRWIIWNYDNE